MNRRVLIISPYFPPSNAADMQRIRMSLPYFSKFGWDAEVVIVSQEHSGLAKDELLLQSVPKEIRIHEVGAFDHRWTSRAGLGSLALRSLWFYRSYVNRLLSREHFDLVYFSTTQFPLTILGPYWKKRFGIPFIVDLQDPWHSDYYRDNPGVPRPPKYWFSYRLNKYLEPLAMRRVDGLISVSANYIADLKQRYPIIKDVPAETITFGAYRPDLDIAEANKALFVPLLLPGMINLVYIGRGGGDMRRSVSVLFEALRAGLAEQPDIFGRLRFYFIGTSYAPAELARETMAPVAELFGVGAQVTELTGRIGYYHTLLTLKQADALFIPGSDDPKYTASKIYPYLLTKKPLLGIFNQDSPAIPVLKEYGATDIYDHNAGSDGVLNTQLFLRRLAEGRLGPVAYSAEAEYKYSAENMTLRQCSFFEKVLSRA